MIDLMALQCALSGLAVNHQSPTYAMPGLVATMAYIKAPQAIAYRTVSVELTVASSFGQSLFA